jgi:hypothetical protein
MTEYEGGDDRFEEAAFLENIDAMFVQTAAGFDCTADRLTLRGVTPSTIYFSDRPERVVGHIGTTEFVDLWDAGADSFEADPPNAVLAFGEPGRTVPLDVVVTITAPHLHADDLSYAMSVLEGDLPRTAGGCTLFIDPFGRPLSPMSVAGMRRRSRRRTRRRVALAAAAT